jgi:hypothetical protein
MILLHDEIEIDKPPAHLFKWFENLDENYLNWHPDHVSCLFLSDGPLRKGSVVHCEEYLHGKLHTLEFQITRVVPNYRIDYDINVVMKGAFLFDPLDDHTLFGADILFGIDLPVVGQLVDAILPHVFSSQIRDLKQHMAEEGRNLKKLIENEVGRGHSLERTIKAE